MAEMECFQGVDAAVEVYLPLNRRVGKLLHILILVKTDPVIVKCLRVR